MAEWFKAAVLKTVDGESYPGVRIPLPPPKYLFYNQYISMPFASYCGGIATRLWREGLSGEEEGDPSQLDRHPAGSYFPATDPTSVSTAFKANCERQRVLMS